MKWNEIKLEEIKNDAFNKEYDKLKPEFNELRNKLKNKINKEIKEL